MVLKGYGYWIRQLANDYHIAAIDSQTFKLDRVRLSCGQLGAAILGRISEHPEDFVTYTSNVNLTFELNPTEPDIPIAFISRSKTNRIPPVVCAVRVRPEDDPLNIFAPHVSFNYVPGQSSKLIVQIRVRVPLGNVPPAYFAQPYPCILLIQTSVGTRMVKLSVIQQADANSVKAIAMEAWARRVSECYAKSRSFNPTWKIDPGDYYNEKHFWDVVVAGLRSGEQVSLRNQQGRAVAAIRAGGEGTARLRALLSPNDYDGKLIFTRSSAPVPLRRLRIEDEPSESDAPLSENYIRIDVKQTQFLLQSEIENGETVVAAASIMLGTRHALLVVQPSGVLAYDLSQPQYPRDAARLGLPRLSGALPLGNKILAWGDKGIYALEIDLEHGEISVAQLSTLPTLGAARVGQRLFVLSQDRVDLWEQNDRREELFKAPQARFLTATSTHLLVASDDNIKIYRIVGQERPVHLGEHRVEGLSSMAASRLIGREEQVVLERCSGSELIDLSNPKCVTVLADYSDLPELALLTRDRDLLIEADKNGRFLRIYSVGATAFL
jgi:hypothetical protein